MSDALPNPPSLIASLEIVVAGLDAWTKARPEDEQVAAARASALRTLEAVRGAFVGPTGEELEGGTAVPPYPG